MGMIRWLWLSVARLIAPGRRRPGSRGRLTGQRRNDVTDDLVQPWSTTLPHAATSPSGGRSALSPPATTWLWPAHTLHTTRICWCAQTVPRNQPQEDTTVKHQPQDITSTSTQRSTDTMDANA